MSVRWYFSLQGEVYGPVESGDLKNLLELGELKLDTMVLEEGAENWQPLSELKDLSLGNEGTYLGERTSPQTFVLEPVEGVQAELSASKPFLGSDEVTVTQQESQNDAAMWVILKGVTEGGKEKFLQEGPYPTSEVLKKLKSGEIRYADHCWRDGMAEWKALRDEPTFAGLPADDLESSVDLTPVGETDIQIPESIPLEDIGSVQFSSTEVHSMALEEPVPPEAGSEDLASSGEDFNFTEDSVIFENPLKMGKSDTDEPEESSPFLNNESAVMELEEREKSVTKAPISNAFDHIEKPAPSYSADSEPVKVHEVGRSLRQPQVRQKLLEVQMQQKKSTARPSSSMTRLFILLVGALLLLVFGLQLARDLAP